MATLARVLVPLLVLMGVVMVVEGARNHAYVIARPWFFPTYFQIGLIRSFFLHMCYSFQIVFFFHPFMSRYSFSIRLMISCVGLFTPFGQIASYFPVAFNLCSSHPQLFVVGNKISAWHYDELALLRTCLSLSIFFIIFSYRSLLSTFLF